MGHVPGMRDVRNVWAYSVFIRKPAAKRLPGEPDRVWDSIKQVLTNAI
jgi:hypothetical protein